MWKKLAMAGGVIMLTGLVGVFIENPRILTEAETALLLVGAGLLSLGTYLHLDHKINALSEKVFRMRSRGHQAKAAEGHEGDDGNAK